MPSKVPSARSAFALAMFALATLALTGCNGAAAPGATQAARPAANPGEQLYVRNCVACHQKSGAGVPAVQPSLVGTPVTVGDPQALLAWMMFGTRPVSLVQGKYRGVMPKYAHLSDQDLAALLTYVRTSFGNTASAITPAMVAEARAARPR